jgi:dihydrolipoamide dehydrogenase
VAAENAAGGNDVFDARTIPSVAYTDPEIAWAGLTETSAAQQGVAYELATIPWAASGRAMTLGHTDGRTKLLVEPGSHRILGVGIVGPNAGELIAEHVLAIEMGAVAEDIARSIHPHPTLSETGALAAEWAQGTITDLYRPPAPAATGSASA